MRPLAHHARLCLPARVLALLLMLVVPSALGLACSTGALDPGAAGADLAAADLGVALDDGLPPDLAKYIVSTDLAGSDLAGSCADGVLDGNESDIDCGGHCNPCRGGRTCHTSTDCGSELCLMGLCAAPPPPPSCTDGNRNGDETDLDCGGPTCGPCDQGGVCLVGRDCKSSLCVLGHCALSCTDRKRDGDETDLDCGGSCPSCALGLACVGGSDCQSSRCVNNVCVLPLMSALPTFDAGKLYPAGAFPTVLAAGDLDGDGRMDVLAGSESGLGGGTVEFLAGVGDGSFRAPRSTAALGRPDSLALVDLDRDGHLDSVMSAFDGMTSDVAALFGKGDGSFGRTLLAGVASDYRFGLCDANGDGRTDVAVHQIDAPEGVLVLLGTPMGGLRPGSETAALRVGTPTCADFDGDGHPDLVTSGPPTMNFDATLLFFGGRGDGSFLLPRTEIVAPQRIHVNPPGIGVAGDFDEDGHPDLAFIGGVLDVMRGVGDGNFEAAVPYPAGSPVVIAPPADWNHDGHLDLAVADAMGGISVFVGRGDGSFPVTLRFATPGAPARDLVIGDWNGDGKPDLAVANGAGVVVLLNTTP